jgi:hypothetical protein
MDLLGTYSNHDLQVSLRRLAGKLAAVRASGGPRRGPRSAGSEPAFLAWVTGPRLVVQGL